MEWIVWNMLSSLNNETVLYRILTLRPFGLRDGLAGVNDELLCSEMSDKRFLCGALRGASELAGSQRTEHWTASAQSALALPLLPPVVPLPLAHALTHFLCINPQIN